MASNVRRALIRFTVLPAVAIAAAGGYIWSGVYDVGADTGHTGPVRALLETVRERSVAVRASDLQPPDLDDPARIRQGAGNYDAMCVDCHLAPGVDETELSRGLNPQPPNLGATEVDAAEAFWTIKHGIKMTGMPAWGQSMGDEYIWNMVALVRQLPRLDAQQYRALVDSSEGHSHGGGEGGGHAHPDGDHPRDTASGAAGDHMAASPPDVHVHADGKAHVHAPARPQPAAAPDTSPASGPEATSPESGARNHDNHDHDH